MRTLFNEKAQLEVGETTRWYRDNGGIVPSRAFVQELRRVAQLAAEYPTGGGAVMLEHLRQRLPKQHQIVFVEAGLFCAPWQR